MVRPRFFALPPERQRAIVDAAFEEFAEHGYTEASLNRIIDAAGISKGSMYYYVDGKQDLYGHVLRTAVERLIVASGPFPVPDADTPEVFWATVQDHCRRLVAALDAAPRLAGLLRDWMSGAGAPAMDASLRDAETTAVPWLAEVLAAGQSIGAIRTDVPDGILIAAATALGRVLDVWVITGPAPAVDHDQAVHVVVDMMRRALAP